MTYLFILNLYIVNIYSVAQLTVNLFLNYKQIF